MMQYLLVSVGCIECGEDTEIEDIVPERLIPEGYRIVHMNDMAGVTYSTPDIAVMLGDWDF